VRLIVRILGRVVEGSLLLLTLAIVTVLVLGTIATQRGWPQTTGTITVAALHRPVTVIRDAAGIVQITADDRHDLFVAQGYVHAQERMWQMEISRRIGAGRLSELFGSSQVETDTYIRTLGWQPAAQRDLEAMTPETMAVLQAYADGVNAWINEHDGLLSTPFVLAGLLSGTGGLGGIALDPWTPLDTATFQKAQAWLLGGNVDTEIFRFLADDRLGDPALTDQLLPAYEADMPVITRTEAIGDGGGAAAPPEEAPEGGAATTSTGAAADRPAALSADHAAGLVAIARLADDIAALAGIDRGTGLLGDHGVGSNNWVVSGSLTRSGAPILANDPHLGFSMPSVWIMNGLHCATVDDDCPWDVAGVTFPGAPGVILGHNARIAWGATNVNPDTQDLFLESPDPSDRAGHYLSQGRSVAYDLRHETIRVAGGPDVEITVRSTNHGVVLSDVDSRLRDGDVVLALAWAGTAEVDRTIEAFLRVDLASSFEEFRAAMDAYGGPSQNFVYADVDGHIGYVLPGAIPMRSPTTPRDCPGLDCPPTYDDGNRIRRGESGEEDWIGTIPRDQLPWQLDPAAGRIVSANNAAVDGDYPYWLGDEWDPGYRAARITERLDALPAGGMTTDDMTAIQLDTRLGRADRAIAAIQHLAPRPGTDDGRILLARLVDWDRACEVDSAGCAAYVVTELALQRAIFDDELGPLARDWTGSTYSWQALLTVLEDPASYWWGHHDPDAPDATASGEPATVVANAIDEAAGQLRAALGDAAGWTWDRLHTVTFRDSTFGSSGILPFEWYFDTQARPVAGADGAVLNTYYRLGGAYGDPDDPTSVGAGVDHLFDVTNGPSYRLTVDMSDLDGARIIITTGQSGNPFSNHYQDLVGLWATGQTVPLPFSPDNVAASAVQTLTLSPP